MPTTEFQTESSLWPEAQTCDYTVGFDWGDTHRSQAPLQSMLLGLHFRHRLTSSEKDLLRMLVHESATVFLRLGEEHIHLDDTDDVPIDTVPTAQVTGTDAMFTHRWRPDRAAMSGARLLHTARIGRIDDRDLMLGVTEPDTGSDPDTTQARLAELVDRFRQAMSEASAVAGHLRARLPQSDAWLLINRASGRVLATGRRAGALLNSGQADLLGREYSSLAASLSQIVTERGLQLDNVEIRQQHLTIATILPRRSGPPTRESEPFFSKFFAHMMRNKLSAIATASSHLSSLATERNQAEECELAEIILSQADELDRQIERFRVLLDYDRLQPRTTTLGDMIKSAVGQAEKFGGCRIEIAMPPGRAATSCNIPPEAGNVLVEAIILAQRGNENNSGQTRIAVSTSSQPLSIEVTTRLSDGQAPARFRSGWQDYVRRLAAAMQWSYECRCSDEKTLITVITPTANRK